MSKLPGFVMDFHPDVQAIWELACERWSGTGARMRCSIHSLWFEPGRCVCLGCHVELLPLALVLSENQSLKDENRELRARLEAYAGRNG